MGPKISRTARQPTTANQPVTLNFWGVYDSEAIFEPIIAAYQAEHPNVTIHYNQQEPALYEFVSLNLLASQDGPDIWLIPADWLPKHRDKLSPVPEGLLAKQNPPATQPRRSLFRRPSPPAANATLFPQLFASAAAENNLLDNQIYTLPLAADTLGLFGNMTLLEAAGYTNLPATWEVVVEAAKKLAKRSTLTVTEPVINLGTSNNVARSIDILAVLMMQNHTPMVSPDKTEALFNQTIVKTTGEPVQPGPAAIDFYTSFASPTKENFSWSASQSQDFDLFKAGKLPLFIDYSYRVRDLQQQAPDLNWQTGPFPKIAQSDQPLTVSTPLVVGVPTVSDYPNQAWDFIQFLTNKGNALAYARASGRPPARRDLATDPAVEPKLRPFIQQLGWATVWYRNEINKTDTVFKQAIDAVLAGQPITDVIDKLTKQVTHILRHEPYE